MSEVVKNKQYYYGLDILRFISAVFVLFYHLGYSVWANKGSAFTGKLDADYNIDALSFITWFGWIGVEIFFVISGFVICQSASRYNIIGFIRSRVVRLYPSVLIVTPFSLLAGLGLGMFDLSSGLFLTLKTMTLFPLHPWIDPVYWTLAVEVVFYAIVALFVFRGAWEVIFKWAVLVSVICLIFNSLSVYNVLYRGGDSTLGLPLQIQRLFFLSYGAFFAFGIFLWFKLYSDKKVKIMLIISFIACLVEVVAHVLYVSSKSGVLISVSASLVPVIFYCFAMCFFIFSIFNPSFYYGWGDRLHVIFKAMGKMTYPLYLIHFTVGVWLLDIVLSNSFINNYAALFFIATLLIAFSYLIATYVEPHIAKHISNAYMNVVGIINRVKFNDI
jgi:peptidoglycan/LPS O-acetylase OafA/YrhL